MNSLIRPALIDDANAIAAVHVASLRFAYAGLVDGAALGDPKLEAAQQVRWRTRIEHPEPATAIFVAEDRETAGGILGFAFCVPNQRRDKIPTDARLQALYLHPDAIGAGHGRALIAQAFSWFRETGSRSFHAFCIDANRRARSFYEAMGGVHSQETTETFTFLNTELVHSAYLWDVEEP